MTADALALDPELASHPLRCDRCGRILECTPADVRVYTVIGPPACCGRPMTFPVVPPVAAAPVLPGRRRPARAGSRVHVRRAGRDPAPDLADGLVDLSADGLGVRLEVQMVPGEVVEVTLRSPGASRTVVRSGKVKWCRPGAGGRYLAGIRLAQVLTPAEVGELAQ